MESSSWYHVTKFIWNMPDKQIHTPWIWSSCWKLWITEGLWLTIMLKKNRSVIRNNQKSEEFDYICGKLFCQSPLHSQCQICSLSFIEILSGSSLLLMLHDFGLFWVTSFIFLWYVTYSWLQAGLRGFLLLWLSVFR